MINDRIDLIRSSIGKRLVGKPEVTDLVIIALLCRGHVLIEDVPGTGKTTLAKTLAAALGCSFRRIQFTPDVMPTDVTGFSMLDTATGKFNFMPGVIFNQVILADEINRTSPKTQSALLEAMQENQVTIDGRTYKTPEPFMVLATQNPIEYVGTYALPEAQLDRFFIRVSLGYPDKANEVEILDRHDNRSEAAPLSAVLDVEQVLEIQRETDKIHVSPALKRYIADLVSKTRLHKDVQLGISPRGAIFLMYAAKGSAILAGHAYATPDDVQKMALPVLEHRLLIKSEAKLRSVTSSGVIAEIIATTPLPEV
ncbi:MAG: MoxR family ATPase [Oscillospiraceae bacterium]|jgi:MoxR-like ATPase|nr:MoxR family ATPase [Oscillospiraceae bacterium]